MATAEFSRDVPAELSERFLAVEGPSFEVVRAAGDVRLWSSFTRPHLLHGVARTGSVRYHVTTGDQADYLLMRDFEAATANFEAVAGQQSAEVRS